MRPITFGMMPLVAHRGREVKRTRDGLLAIFDNPARAVRCADAMTRAAREGSGLSLEPAGTHELKVCQGLGRCFGWHDDAEGSPPRYPRIEVRDR